MLDLENLDLGAIADALADQVGGYEHQEYPDLLPVWYEFRDTRAMRRAVEWLAGQSLIDDAAADRYLASHPEPGLP